MRTINAEEIINYANELSKLKKHRETAQLIVEAINSAPTVYTVLSQKKAEWIKDVAGWKCSGCGKWHVVIDSFCSRCGAKMSGAGIRRQP